MIIDILLALAIGILVGYSTKKPKRIVEYQDRYGMYGQLTEQNYIMQSALRNIVMVSYSADRQSFFIAKNALSQIGRNYENGRKN